MLTSGLDLMRQFMGRSMGDAFNNAGIISFLQGLEESRSATAWHRGQADAMIKARCPDYESTEDGDDDPVMNNVFNNVITDQETLAVLMKELQVQGQEAATPTSAPTPAPGVLQRYRWLVLLATALGAGIAGVGLNEFLNPRPKHAILEAGTTFDMIEGTYIEESGSSSGSISIFE